MTATLTATRTSTSSRNYSYDDADRITTSGTDYDDLGRTVTTPAQDTALLANGDVTITYHAWQITNLHGDLVAGLDNNPGLAYTSEATEYGLMRNTTDTGSRRYAWLGKYQRAADTADGSILMGVRLYNGATGRFDTVDSVYGGSCNRYEYVCGAPTSGYDLDGKVTCWINLLGCWGAFTDRKITKVMKVVGPKVRTCLRGSFQALFWTSPGKGINAAIRAIAKGDGEPSRWLARRSHICDPWLRK